MADAVPTTTTTSLRRREDDVDDDDENRSILGRQPHGKEDSGSHSSMPFASFNYINSIVGSGIIGMSYALHQGGVLVGLATFVLLGVLTDYSLILLIKSAQLCGANSYAGVMSAAFGTPGYVLISLLQFLYPIIAMVSYNVIVGDTVTKVVVYYADLAADSVWSRRELFITLTTLLLTLPLSLHRGMVRLARFSFVALCVIAFVLCAVFVRIFTLGPSVPQSADAWTLARPQLTQSIAISSFAFMCHHSTFLVYGSLKHPSEERWKRLTHTSVAISTLIEILFAVFGYATFTGYVQGDLLENYCRDDHLMNAARILFSLTILLTYPIECFVARDTVLAVMCGVSPDHTAAVDPHDAPADGAWWRSSSDRRRIFVTVAIVTGTCFTSFATDCLGIVLEINGVVAAIPLAFILPSVTYLRLEPSTWRSIKKTPALLLAVFGLTVLVLGVVMIIVQWAPDASCSHGVEMFYCRRRD